MDKKINIIIIGVNYFGEMASTQRIRNLFEPLFEIIDMSVVNFAINDKNIINFKSKVSSRKFNYNYWNPFSILAFLFSISFYSIRNYNKNSRNIIYHYGYPSLENIFFLKIAKFWGYKIVYDIVENISHADHGKSSLRLKLKSWSSRKMLKQLYKNGSLCFAISNGLLDYLTNLCKNKIPVIHLPICIDVNRVYSFKNDKLSNSMCEPIKVFYGGSFGFKDGFEYLLEGFELACETNSNIELVLTGKISKQMNGKVQTLISSSKFKQRISFLGCLSETDYYATMVNSDILCMNRINSAYANFGFPFKLGEYLASGNAIIATKVGDVPQYLVNGQNALVIKPELSIEICNAILILAQDQDLRLKLGKAAYDTTSIFFSGQKVSKVLLENLIALYDPKDKN